MADEPTQPSDPIPAPTGDPSIRLIPMSDIDAFVEVRAGSILDEAAILAIQFLGGGDRNASRSMFVQLAMERFDAIGTKYDELRMMTAFKARMAARRARLEADKAAAADPPPPAEGQPE